MGLPPVNTPALPSTSASDTWGQKLNQAIAFRSTPEYHEAVLPDRLKADELEAAFGGAAGAGKSAYDLAVDNGYVGTVSQWLTSLKGTAGTQVMVYDKFADAPANLPSGTVVLSISGL